MIHSFTCKNFYSFGEPTTVDFTVNDNAPDNQGYAKAPSEKRLSKVEAVIGPNASGKTNLLKVLPLLKWIIVKSYQTNPNMLLPIQPFAFGGLKDEDSELEVIFEINSSIYNYVLVLNKNQIISEELTRTSLVKENKSTKKVFSRVWDKTKKQYYFEAENLDLPKGFDLLRKNASFISGAARFGNQESQEIVEYWNKVETNVNEAGWVGGHSGVDPQFRLLEALDFYNNNQQLKKKAESLLSRFDLGLSGFSIEIEKHSEISGLQMQTKASALHTYKGKEYPLAMQYESSGTMQLFVLLKNILQALAKGSIAILDEFDVNLHPEMVLVLFNLFMKPETNPNNAQLLMSTHSHLILSKLDKYQIALVEKDDDGISESWRLDEMSGIRADDNYYAKYMAGAYGAAPKIGVIPKV